MIFGYLMMVIAVTISAIAAWYSVAGLTAIFAAAVVPVIIMGGALEAGKIAATVWLHNNWERVSWAYKTYLIPAIVFLMLLTSMGIFGFLSKAHSDQSLVSGDSMSKVAIYDEQIATEKGNVEANRKALTQMDSQVDSLLGRSDTSGGAERAVMVRKQQAKERARLQAEISTSQKSIVKLQAERAPFAAEFRKVEAEVGPIKYIAALIYGDNPDQNVLEKAVRWVIILIVIVFDPLALCLILASNKQLEWAVEDKIARKEEEHVIGDNTGDQPPPDPDPDPLPEMPPVDLIEESEEYNAEEEQRKIDDFFASLAQVSRRLDEETKQPEEPIIVSVEEEQPNFAATNDTPIEEEASPPPTIETVLDLPQEQIEEITAEDTTLKPRFDPAVPTLRGDYAVRYQGKVYNLDAFNSMHPELALSADNDIKSTESQCGFGSAFPDNPAKGDMFIRVDYMPERLFKWNNQKWIEIDKNSTDSYTYNQAYIKHLIAKLEAGEYEIEDLSDSEQAQVEEQIESIVKSKNA